VCLAREVCVGGCRILKQQDAVAHFLQITLEISRVCVSVVFRPLHQEQRE